MKNFFLFLIGLAASFSAAAISIYPNAITISGKPGDKAPVQIMLYNHPTVAEVEFVKAKDLRELDDVTIKTFTLGAEQRFMVPLTIVVPEQSTEYYLCGVLRSSQSMRLRVCSAVRVLVKP
jgi:hypothetical protein